MIYLLFEPYKSVWDLANLVGSYFNTLNLFTDRGLVRECVVDPERRFYDSTPSPHHHFYNVDTGELTDIPADGIRFESLPDMPGGSHMESVEVVIKVRQDPSENLA